MPKNLYVEVLLDQNLAKALDYSVPPEMQDRIQAGMRVEVPLKGTLKKGIVAAIKEHSKWPDAKPVARLLSEKEELSEPLWKLARWMASYYCAPLQRVLKCFVPVNIRKEVKPKTKVWIQAAKTHAECLAECEALRTKRPAQAMVLETVLNAGKGIFLQDLLKQEGISPSAIGSLVKNQWLSKKSLSETADLLMEEEFFPTTPKKLNGEQQACVEAIQNSISQNRFAVHLVHGVTGSGKTEVYMRAIQTALDQQKSAILLVPEISLTSQMIERFRSRFSQKIALLHHRRSLGERTDAWESLRNKQAMIAIGARSAVFSPAQNLGLIIVDEEHDGSYKQSDESPCYQGRDVAVMRGSLEQCAVILGSATPSIESRYNAATGKYALHTLSSRATEAPLPKVRIVDMKKALDIAGGFTHFSDELLGALKERLAAGEQSLLFLNRRGYHRMQLCASCRNAIKCPHCDLALTFHKAAGRLQCHLCNFEQTSPRECPHCKSPHSLEFKGFGTEHVERALHAVFPGIRTLRMDRDTTQKKNSHEELFKQFRAHKADVLIGTQMIAKGFHFPSVTLVGVLNADAALSVPDFRSSEQVFQLLTQVAGRAGRSQLPGEVILQTFIPKHPTLLLAAAQDYPSFYAAEIEERRLFGYPPFCHLAKVLFSAADPEMARAQAEAARAHLEKALPPPTQVLPVAPAGHPKIKDLFRFQFLIKAQKINQIKQELEFIQERFKDNIKIDIDPYSTFF